MPKMEKVGVKEGVLILLTNEADKNALRVLVEHLDIIHDEDKRSDGLPQQIITRCVIAMGFCVLDQISLDIVQSQNLKKTIEAGIEYVIYPNASNYDRYFHCATNSFPFGAGEGCHSIRENSAESADSCTVGSGCNSGSGCLIIYGIDNVVIYKAICADLVPWLKENIDPVLNYL